MTPDEQLVFTIGLGGGGQPTPAAAPCIIAPNLVPNLQAWFVADDIAQAPNSTVSSWSAHLGISGGTPYQCVPAASNPIYRVGVLNGHDAVESPALPSLADTLKFSPDVNFPSGEFTDFMVYRSEPTGLASNIIHGRQSSDPNISCVRMPDENVAGVGAFIAYGGLGGGFISDNPFNSIGPQSPFHIGVVRRFPLLAPPGKVQHEHDFLFDGLDRTAAVPLVQTGAYYGSGFVICKSNVFGNPGTQIIEWVLFQRALSDTERVCVYNYLAQRYGFALLP